MRTQLLRALCLSLLCVPGVALAQAAAPAPAVVQGRVLDAEGEPVRGAQVGLYAGAGAEAAANSGAAGEFAFPGIDAGRYTLRVERPGFAQETRVIEVAAGERATLEVTLRPEAVRLEGVEVVSLTRTSTPVAAVPGAVTVIGRAEIEAEMGVSRSLGEILGKAVPGLSVGTQSMSNFGQSLRGRNVSVLIDGVPQSTLRNVSRDFVNLDAAMIERVEVLRGATALFGDGATGGVINIITRSPGRGEMAFSSEVSASGSLSSAGDGFGARASQSVSGRQGAWDYVASGSLTSAGGFYDAEGDLIPADPHGQGGLADTRGYDLFGKLGYVAGDQRIQLSANHFRNLQDTEFTADPAVNQLPVGAKARALGGLREAEPQGTRNTVLSADYSHEDILGGGVRAQLYYRDYLTRFRGFDRRVFDRTTGQLLSGLVSQSFVDSEKWGGRLEGESRPLGLGGPSIVWGADYTYENTSQPVGVMDPAAYDASGGLVFEKIGERLWVPPLRPRSLGVFGQLGWQATDLLMVRGGVRHERIGMQVDDFITLDGNQVFGGDLSYAPTLYNLGVVVGSGTVSGFANFSQGFSLADIGRILRGARDGFDLGGNDLPAPKVDHYEVGARGMWGALESSLSVFRSSSKLGTNLVQNELGMLEVARAPERIHGIEATLDARPLDRLAVGGSVSWAEGELRNVARDRWLPLNGYRIQPIKLVAYLQDETRPGWTNRLQLLHSGSRDRAAEERLDPAKPLGYGEYPVESFTVVDFTSSMRLGAGTLRLGVENLLNRQYFDIVSQLDLTDGNAYHTAARGAAFTLGYSVSY